MAHKNLNQLFRLLQRCKTTKTDVIIHLDSEIQQSEFNVFVKRINESFFDKGIYLVEKRLHGELFKRSLVDITIKMIDYAHDIEKKEEKKYQYFLLCSGQDYPLKPIQEIEAELSNAYPQPFIDCTPYDKHNWMGDRFTKNTADPVLRFLFTNRIKQTKSRIVRGILSRFLKYSKPLILRFGRDVEQRLKSQGISVYGGSQWWILPDIAIAYISSKYHDPDAMKYISLMLNETVTPDETFFQTLTMCSPVKNRVQLNSLTERKQHNKTWSYWQGENKPLGTHPYVIKYEDFEKLKACNAWFARKFDETIDSDVLDRIDRELLGYTEKYIEDNSTFRI